MNYICWSSTMDNEDKPKSTDKHLLIGNGFSRGLHDAFKYKSLFKKAKITGKTRELFGSDGDFEDAIFKLNTTIEVLKSLELDHDNRLSTIIE